MTTRNISYGSTASVNGVIDGTTTSATWTTGMQWFIIDNSSDLAIDRFQTGDWKFTSGSSASSTSEIRIYVIGSYDGSTWPDTVTGVAGNSITFTSQGVRDSVARLACRFIGDSNFAGGKRYRFSFSLAELFDGIIPKKTTVFFTMNTGTIDASGTNMYYDTPIFETIT
jgi:hypothetical protein